MFKNGSQNGIFLIRYAALRPGDVILMMGCGKLSEQIANESESEFSHAILVVSPWDWFEADEHGVGYSEPWTSLDQLEDQQSAEFVVPLTECSGAVLLRHPTLSTFDPSSIQSALQKIVEPWEGKDYSDYQRLFSPLLISGKARWLVKWGLKLKQKMRKREKDGMFCSEVVARAYEELHRTRKFGDSSLFCSHRDAHKVHPGHLFLSRLVPVQNAIIDSRKLSTEARFSCASSEYQRNRTKMSRSAQKLDGFIDRLKRCVDNINADILNSERDERAKLEHKLRSTLLLTNQISKIDYRRRIESLIEEFDRLSEEVERYFESGRHEPLRFADFVTRRLKLKYENETVFVDALIQAKLEGRFPEVSDEEIEKRRSLIKELGAQAAQTFSEHRKGLEARIDDMRKLEG